MRVVDLTLPLDSRSSMLHEHPPLQLIPIHRHATHGRSNTAITVSLHAGTHVDSPYHFHAEGPPIDRLSLDQMIAPAVLLDVRKDVTPRAPVTVDAVKRALAAAGGSVRGRIPVVYTGWCDASFYQPNYYVDNPYLAPDLARWFVTERVRAVALDCPPDPLAPTGPSQGDAPAHRTLLGAGIPIIEHICHLDQLRASHFLLFAVPVPVVGADGAPARVIAIEQPEEMTAPGRHPSR
jgi:kynurenine formamidase